jgi:hypothetical protein
LTTLRHFFHLKKKSKTAVKKIILLLPKKEKFEETSQREFNRTFNRNKKGFVKN